MDTMYAAVVLLACVALGELISAATRARIPALLVAMIAMAALTQTGLFPVQIAEASLFVGMGTILQPAIMVHMGTLLPIASLKQQWRPIIISVAGMACATGLILLVVGLLFGYGTAVAGTGPLVGGIVSTLLTTEGLTSAGMTTLAAIPPLVLMLQALPAMPLTAFFLKGHARRLIESGEVKVTRDPDTGAIQLSPEAQAEANRKTLVRLPASVRENQIVLLFMVVAGGALAMYMQGITGVSYSLWGLGLGILCVWSGVLPRASLEKANAFSLGMVAIIVIVAAPLMSASLSQIVTSLGAVVLILLVGMIGIVVGGAIATKLLGWDIRLGMPVALTAMFGFPADYLITTEVARSSSEDPELQKAVQDRILPPMLIGGFTSVSAGSIVIATILVNTL
ncbi:MULTISPECIES: hypothetical protein [Micrococcaceae]|uniref:hypothetical protein n=1 Tax=unclassified Kocuria TaxID=2649579 RepID=UPI0010125E30|nr:MULTISPECIES: hypothetical protein [unclassified Kocuria]